MQIKLANWTDQMRREFQRTLPMLVKKRFLVPTLGLLTLFMVRAELQETAPDHQRERISAYIEAFQPRGMTAAEHENLVESIMEQADALEVPPNMRIDGRPVVRAYLIAAYIRVESSFYRYARSTSDARGYMQLKPTTVAWLDQIGGSRSRVGSMYDTRTNVELGVEYINYLMALQRDVRVTALSYNMGPGNVARGRYDEDYWEKILYTYRILMSGEFEEERVTL
ncbi:MAG: transglycosylase SLT domain-containing protein [Spirochaetales bacterium]|nr:transglycosylase SLT domain-containing protein [Leptospiraceae bacterium]MCP5482613.1 transglycosylase SLT domain-containing protein [Spirochaetales bacterium]MCP5485202.1 transglycosylase SLT domain-containing protein [Spirochaetales bacterium]